MAVKTARGANILLPPEPDLTDKITWKGRSPGHANDPARIAAPYRIGTTPIGLLVAPVITRDKPSLPARPSVRLEGRTPSLLRRTDTLLCQAALSKESPCGTLLWDRDFDDFPV
jgi:hypothetical protein